VLAVEAGATANMLYPSLTHNLHHELELVVAIGTGGKNIKAIEAKQHIFGYAAGLDMTRRDLQNEMKKQGRRLPKPSSSYRQLGNCSPAT